MKKILTFLVMLLCSVSVLMAQEVKFPYQAVVRDSKDHNLWNEKPVKVNVVITQNGETKWEENFTDTTNFNGLLSFNVGEGTPANCTNCNLELIDWSDNVVIKSTFKDPNDGDREISVVETPVMAVPYALQAKNAPLTLTTPQIVKYISEVKVNDQQNDVDSILDAIVANPNGLKQYCKDTVYHYFMNHKQEMKDLALYFIRMVDINGVSSLSLFKEGLEVINLPYCTAGDPSGREILYMPAFIDILQTYVMDSINSDMTGYLGLKDYSKNMIRSGGMRVYISRDDLATSFNTKWEGKDIFVADEDDVDDMFLEEREKTLVSYSVKPARGSKKGKCYVFLIDAQSHKLYFYTSHKVSGSSSGFTSADMNLIYSVKKK